MLLMDLIVEVQKKTSMYTGLSKVAGCPRKLLPTWLVLAGYSLIYLAFLYGWHFLNKISLDWPLTLTTQPSTSKRSDNPVYI